MPTRHRRRRSCRDLQSRYGRAGGLDASGGDTVHPRGWGARIPRARIRTSSRGQHLPEYVYIAPAPVIARSQPSFSPAEWARLGGLYGFVALLHGLGWGLYLHFAAHYPALVGLGFVAYMFGLR